MKNNCGIVRKNLNFQLRVETFFIVDINYSFIYFSLFKVGLHVAKKILTHKWRQNKQTMKSEKPLAHLAYNIKQVQANQLSSTSPKTIRKSIIFWQF